MSKVSSRNPSVCKPTGDAVSGGSVKEIVLKLSTAEAKKSKSSSLSSSLSSSSSSSPGIGVVVFKTISNKRNTTKTQQSMVYPSTVGSLSSSSKVTTPSSAKIVSNSDKATLTTATTTTPVKAPASRLELTVSPLSITPTSRSSINAATPESKASSTINSSRGSKFSSSTVPRRSTFQKANLISSKDSSPNILVQVASSDRPVIIANNSSNSNNNRASSFITSSTCITAPIIVKAPSKHTSVTMEVSADDSSSTTTALGTTRNISDQSQTMVTGDYESKCNDNGTTNIILTKGVNNDDNDVDHDRGGDDDNDNDDDEKNDDFQGDLQSLKHDLFLLKGDQAIESFDQLHKKLIDETAKAARLKEQYHESQSKVIELMNDLKNSRLEAQSSLSFSMDKNNELMSIVLDKDREISELKQHNNRDSQYHHHHQKQQHQLSVVTADISNNNNNNNNVYQVNNSVEELPRYQIALVNMDKELTKLKQEVLFFQKQSIKEKRSADLLTKQLLEQANKNQELQAQVQVLSSELMNVSRGKESKATLVKVKDNLIARYHSLVDLHEPKTVNNNDDDIVTLVNAKEGVLVEQKSFEISNRSDTIEIEQCMKRLQFTNSILMVDLKRALQEKKSLCALLQEKDYLLGNFESLLRQKEGNGAWSSYADRSS